MALYELKDGSITKDPRLDRLKHFDERSRNYQVRTMLPDGARIPRRRSIVVGPSHDQGQEGACTGFGAVHAAQAKPISKGVMNAQIAREWYFENQRIDYWPGGAYPGANPFYEGSSVLATMQTGVTRGMWSSYRWVGAGSGTVMQDTIDSLRYVAPVVFGLDWLESMFYPDQYGVIEIDHSSEVMGGHCVAGQDALYMKPGPTHPYGLWMPVQQSWGTDYGAPYKGYPGFVFIKLDEAFEQLLEQGGEGAVPIR